MYTRFEIILYSLLSASPIFLGIAPLPASVKYSILLVLLIVFSLKLLLTMVALIIGAENGDVPTLKSYANDGEEVFSVSIFNWFFTVPEGRGVIKYLLFNALVPLLASLLAYGIVRTIETRPLVPTQMEIEGIISDLREKITSR